MNWRAEVTYRDDTTVTTCCASRRAARAYLARSVQRWADVAAIAVWKVDR